VEGPGNKEGQQPKLFSDPIIHRWGAIGGKNMTGLGRLDKLDIRDQWQNEEYDFTPWLAKESNIQLLADEIGLDLEVEDTEVFIGSYKADIVAKDGEDRKVIIENQLSKTDHKHLGQLLTYASGIGAKIVIWICKEVTDEHRQAIDWLNEVTIADVAFFACEVELWKIGNSPWAPKFKVVSSPNDWSKSVKGAVPAGALSETKKAHLDFWNGFKEFMSASETDLKLRTPRPQHWYSIAIGRSKFNISLTTNTQAKRIGCEIYIRGKNAKTAFAMLQEKREIIENDLGKVEWQELPEGQDCRIIQYREGDSKNKNNWESLHQWLKDRSEAFYRVFSPIIKSLPLSEE
jgi:hypothetical protein